MIRVHKVSESTKNKGVFNLLMENENNLEQLKQKLIDHGYHVTIVGDRISVMGMGRGYFKVKQAGAKSILSNLIHQGYNAKSEIHHDGYYDFWVYLD